MPATMATADAPALPRCAEVTSPSSRGYRHTDNTTLADDSKEQCHTAAGHGKQGRDKTNAPTVSLPLLNHAVTDRSDSRMAAKRTYHMPCLAASCARHQQQIRLPSTLLHNRTGKPAWLHDGRLRLTTTPAIAKTHTHLDRVRFVHQVAHAAHGMTSPRALD